MPFFHALVFNDLIRMKSNLRKLIPTLNFHFIVKSFKVDTFFASRRKFQLEQLQKPNLVYEFKCPWNEENYIGETTLRLSARVSSHVNQRPVTSVKEHTDNCPKFQVLYKTYLKENKKVNAPRNFADFLGRYFERLKTTREPENRKFLEAALI